MMYGCDAAMSVMCFYFVDGKSLENWLTRQSSQSKSHWQRQLKYFVEPLLIQEEQILTMTPECPIHNLKMFNRFPQHDCSHPYLTHCSPVSLQLS